MFAFRYSQAIVGTQVEHEVGLGPNAAGASFASPRVEYHIFLYSGLRMSNSEQYLSTCSELKIIAHTPVSNYHAVYGCIKWADC